MKKLCDLLAGVELECGSPPSLLGCGPNDEVTSVAIDSREVTRDGMFIALRGTHADGHGFVDRARIAGAKVAVVERAPAGCELPLIVVRDTHRALASIAANWHGRPAERLSLAAVTGTNGKTTTVHLLSAILQQAGRGHARLGTTGSWIVDHERPSVFTTPFPLELHDLLSQTLARGGTDVVMEVSSHAIAQSRIGTLRFQVAGLTSFSQDHLDFHPDMESYLATKCRLASEFLVGGAVVVTPRDIGEAGLRFAAAASDATVWHTSKTPDRRAEIHALHATFEASGITAKVATPAGTLSLRSPLLGAYNLDNLLVTIGLALGMGAKVEDIERGLATSTGAPGRLERVGPARDGDPTVFVDYAHTPDAVTRALEAVRANCFGQLIVVLGCGGDRDPSKRPQMAAAAATLADQFYATSDNPRTEDPDRIIDHMLAGVDRRMLSKVVRERDRSIAIAQAILHASKHDVVVIAGKGHETYQVVGQTRIHFDDREHAAAALRARSD